MPTRQDQVNECNRSKILMSRHSCQSQACLRKDYVRNGIMTPGLSAHSDGLGHVPPGSAAGSASSLWLVGVRQKDLMSRQAETQRQTGSLLESVLRSNSQRFGRVVSTSSSKFAIRITSISSFVQNERPKTDVNRCNPVQRAL